jgi:hypothetical protein
VHLREAIARVHLREAFTVIHSIVRLTTAKAAVCHNKRKRDLEGSIPWANMEFQQQAASELDSAWQNSGCN